MNILIHYHSNKASYKLSYKNKSICPFKFILWMKICYGHFDLRLGRQKIRILYARFRDFYERLSVQIFMFSICILKHKVLKSQISNKR